MEPLHPIGPAFNPSPPMRRIIFLQNSQDPLTNAFLIRYIQYIATYRDILNIEREQICTAKHDTTTETINITEETINITEEILTAKVLREETSTQDANIDTITAAPVARTDTEADTGAFMAEEAKENVGMAHSAALVAGRGAAKRDTFYWTPCGMAPSTAMRLSKHLKNGPAASTFLAPARSIRPCSTWKTRA
jgi:hypothetical protein